MPPDELDLPALRLKSCTEKIRYDTKQGATRAAHKFNSLNHCKKPHQRVPYPCHFCGGWHIGRPSVIGARLAKHFKDN